MSRSIRQFTGLTKDIEPDENGQVDFDVFIMDGSIRVDKTKREITVFSEEAHYSEVFSNNYRNIYGGFSSKTGTHQLFFTTGLGVAMFLRARYVFDKVSGPSFAPKIEKRRAALVDTMHAVLRVKRNDEGEDTFAVVTSLYSASLQRYVENTMSPHIFSVSPYLRGGIEYVTGAENKNVLQLAIILYQLANTLHYLDETINFRHNDLNLNSVLVSYDPAKLNACGLPIVQAVITNLHECTFVKPSSSVNQDIVTLFGGLYDFFKPVTSFFNFISRQTVRTHSSKHINDFGLNFLKAGSEGQFHSWPDVKKLASFVIHHYTCTGAKNLATPPSISFEEVFSRRIEGSGTTNPMQQEAPTAGASEDADDDTPMPMFGRSRRRIK